MFRILARKKIAAFLLLCLAVLIGGCQVASGGPGGPSGPGASDLVVSSVSPLTSAALETSADWPITAELENTGSTSVAAYVVRFAVHNAYTGATVNVDATITTPLDPRGSVTVTKTNLDKGTTLVLNGVGSGTNTVTVKVIEQADGSSSTYTQQATVPVFYSMLVVETYNATGPSDLTKNFSMDLFGAGGDTTPSPYILWDTPAGSYTALVAAPSSTMIDFDQSGFPYISHGPDITPNSDFYVRIRGTNPSDFGAYGIRVSTGPLPQLADDTGWYFQFESPGDIPDQAKPSLGGIGVPSVLPQNVIVVSATPYASRLNRYMHAGTGATQADQELDADVDWVKIHLP